MKPKPPYRIMRACDRCYGLFFYSSYCLEPLDTGLRAKTTLGIKRHLSRFDREDRVFVIDANDNEVEIDKGGKLWVLPWWPPGINRKQS